MLGEFEYLLLMAAFRLGDEAYGAAIRQEVETTTGRGCSLGALYTTVDRLESKGLLETWLSEPTAKRGGRAKRMVRVTAKGEREAREFYEAIARISQDVPWATSGVKPIRVGKA